MKIENKQTKTLGLLGLILLLIILSFGLSGLPVRGLSSTLFYRGCTFFDCFSWNNTLKDFKNNVLKKASKDINKNNLAQADVFIDFYFKEKNKVPLNYLIPLKQYNRLITQYKKLPLNMGNKKNFKRDYDNFFKCHQALANYYSIPEGQKNLRKLDYFLLSTQEELENMFSGFFASENLLTPDLSPFQTAVLLKDRCLLEVDDLFHVMKFIATKGHTVDLRAIQKDIIQFETRFGTGFRPRYDHLIHLDTRQYVDQSLSL